ncbi:MAG: hypothetical protein ABW252_24250 [Polyangiales bacterium]
MSEPRVEPSRTSLPARILRLTGLGLWLLAAAAAPWELLALQPPASPLHLGVLAGPIAQLSGFAFALGTAALVASLAWPSLHPEGGGLPAALLLVTGALVHVAALAYAASTGILAVQLLDPRPDARLTLYVRALGHLLTMLGLVAIVRRALR